MFNKLVGISTKENWQRNPFGRVAKWKYHYRTQIQGRKGLKKWWIFLQIYRAWKKRLDKWCSSGKKDTFPQFNAPPKRLRKIWLNLLKSSNFVFFFAIIENIFFLCSVSASIWDRVSVEECLQRKWSTKKWIHLIFIAQKLFRKSNCLCSSCTQNVVWPLAKTFGAQQRCKQKLEWINFPKGHQKWGCQIFDVKQTRERVEIIKKHAVNPELFWQRPETMTNFRFGGHFYRSSGPFFSKKGWFLSYTLIDFPYFTSTKPPRGRKSLSDAHGKLKVNFDGWIFHEHIFYTPAEKNHTQIDKKGSSILGFCATNFFVDGNINFCCCL